MITSVNPLFKWTGSKRKMFPKYEHIFEGLEFENFIDLCGGTGVTSVWINKNFPNANIFLNEINVDIFGIYHGVKYEYNSFISLVDYYERTYLALERKEDRKAMYLAIREEFHDNYHTMDVLDRSCMLYFLLCTNFNGIWQAKASTGLYYTPFGNGNEKAGIYNRQGMADFKQMVDKATITCGSYEKVVIPDNSLIFADPPYVSSHTKYDNRESFSDLMQVELAEFLIAHSKNNKFAFCNKDHPIFRDILSEFRFEEFDVKYTASSKDTAGAKAKEILVHNFNI